MYASGITFTGVSAVSPAPTTVINGDNGLSLSTVLPNTVVLGQDVGELGNPAALLSAREIPAAGFPIEYTDGGNGSISFNAGAAAMLLHLIANNLLENVVPAAGIQLENTTAGMSGNQGQFSPVLSFIGNAFASGSSASVPVNILQWAGALQSVPGRGYWAVEANYAGSPAGFISLSTADPAGSGFFGIGTLDPQATLHAAGAKPFVLIQNATSGIFGIQFQDPATNLIGSILVAEQTIRTGDSVVIVCTMGFITLNPANVEAMRLTTSGNVLIGTTTDTTKAFLQIAPGTTGKGQLQLEAGSPEASPTAGNVGYDGTNFLACRTAGTQEYLLTGATTAAPATTATPVFTSFYGGNTKALGDPVAWSTVEIAGTTYKIPLYT